MTHAGTHERTGRRRRIRIAVAVAAVLLASAACERETDPVVVDPPPPPPPPSDWRPLEGSPALALETASPEDDPELARTIERARAGLDAARTRWTVGDSDERARWHVLWRATPAEGPAEHLWVQPVHWSPFRVEGRLASPPRSRLVPEAGLGDLVSIPTDAIIDWRRRGPDGSIDGDALRRLLERRHGPADPPETGNGRAEDPPTTVPANDTTGG